MLRTLAILLLSLPLCSLLAAEDVTPTTLAEASAKALTTSSLREPGSKPFHMKMIVRDVQNLNSDKHAEIEEFWVSPTSWKRIITTPDLKQVVTVNESGRHVQFSGVYFPVWLQAFVTALEDPIPPVMRQNGQAKLPPPDPAKRNLARCANLSVTTKDFPSAPASICFAASNRLSSVTYPGYRMEFNEYSTFAGKDTPYLYLSQYSDSLLSGKVALLEKLPKNADLSIPAGSVAADSPTNTFISPAVFTRLAKTPLTMTWPEVPGGKTKGNILAYLSLDKTGTLREVIILQSDNQRLDLAVREKLLGTGWRTAISKGSSIQVASLLSFPFETTSSNTSSTAIQAQTISSDSAKGLAILQPRPQYPFEARMHRISGTVCLSALIDETGSIVKLGVIESPADSLSTASMDAVRQWKYRPYLVDGVPTPVLTMITINFDISR